MIGKIVRFQEKMSWGFNTWRDAQLGIMASSDDDTRHEQITPDTRWQVIRGDTKGDRNERLYECIALDVPLEFHAMLFAWEIEVDPGPTARRKDCCWSAPS